MSTPTCPKCRRAIPSEEVNVASDIAYCRPCNAGHRLSALVQIAELAEGVDFNRPPPGVSLTNDGSGTILSATHRSPGAAVGLLAISLFWNGIVSVFVLVALAGTLRNLGITAPEWFPAPDMNDQPMGPGMTAFLWVFLTPFILIGLAMIGALLSCVAGRTEVRVGPTEGLVFTGFGPLGWRRSFDPNAVKDVRVDDQVWRDSDGGRQRKAQIVLETGAGKPLKFATMLTPERRKFVAASLRNALVR